MKKIMSVLLIFFGLVFLVACGEKSDTLEVDIVPKLYDVTDKSNSLDEKKVQVGKKYVLHFDVEFTNPHILEAGKWKFWEDDEIVEITTEITLGSFDDKDQNSLNMINLKNTPDGGFPFEPTESGSWRAKTRVQKDKDKQANFENTPFNLDIYNYGDGSPHKITVKMTATNKKISIGNAGNEFVMTLKIEKGNVDFTREETLSQYPDFTGAFTIPNGLPKATFTYYTSEDKKTTFGKVEVINTGSEMKIDFAYHLAKIFYSVEEPTATMVLNMRNRLTQGQYSDYYLKVELDGGNNYNNAQFEYHPFG